ncbi:MAG TPA: hypothetical protein VJB68_05210, partial [Methylophilaceae bacterium]|nr:hypothetical protein [Methylophilaceae bacterium]
MADIDAGSFSSVGEYSFIQARGLLTIAGIPAENVVLENTDTNPLVYPEGTPPLAGYLGPGNHHASNTQNAYRFTWMLGQYGVRAPVANRAVLMSYESYNASTFSLDPMNRVPDGSWQGKLSDAISQIAFGGTNYSRAFSGGVGYTTEPGNTAGFAPEFFTAYASGLTLAQAFSLANRATMGIAVGDPLMRINDATDHYKQLGVACSTDAECFSGVCTADDWSSSICQKTDNSCAKWTGFTFGGLSGNDAQKHLRVFDAMPNGSGACDPRLSSENKSTALLTCGNSAWQRTECTGNTQCTYSDGSLLTPYYSKNYPNETFAAQQSNYLGAACRLNNGQQCSQDAQCAGGFCDEDISGVKRCHSTESSCVGGQNGIETASGFSMCADSSNRRGCTNSAWSVAEACQLGCSSGFCKQLGAESITLNLPKNGELYHLALPVDPPSGKIIDIFASSPAVSEIQKWDTQT